MRESSQLVRNLGLLDRRAFLSQTASGLSSVALTALLAQDNLLAEEAPVEEVKVDPTSPFAARPAHFPAKAKNVVVIFCSGALSHVDTFDYKPELTRLHGKPLPGNERLVSFQGDNGNLTRPLWKFRRRGKCGKMVSDLVPKIGEMSDRICYFHGLHTKSNTHGPGENVMSTGFAIEGFPSMGAWTTYALGSASQNLPAFVAIEDPRGMPQSGPNNWASGFLPAAFQGTPFNAAKPISYLKRPASISAKKDQAASAALKLLNQRHQERFPNDQNLAARIASYELAAKMQLSVPQATNLNQESKQTLQLYGADSNNKIKAGFARNCVLARRLVERGVRFVQVFNGGYASGGRLNWDGHSQLKSQYDVHGEVLDQPVAGLLKDLEQRGLLKSTLVIFCTEFGRMPMFQAGTYGRDHNPFGFTAWMAGAGVKAPFNYGGTDAFGFKAEKDATSIHDFHATVLHLLGLNHKRLTFYHNGIRRRLTDVHGKVIKEVLA